jgi:acetate kinase
VSNEVLVINAGSSSVKGSLFDLGAEGPVLKVHGQVEGIGTPQASGPKDHDEALAFMVGKLTAGRPGWRPAGVGHRVVHGGTRHRLPALIDPAVRAYLGSLVPLAPLHQPANLQGIDAAARAFPGVPQVACFDTAFHHGRPFVAEAFALPRRLYDEGVRRYGFHGLSYEYIVRAMQTTAPEAARGRMVIAHMGNGVSMAAVRDGKPVETTMGFTALDGLPMGTRCGQIDPGVLLYLLDEKKLTPAQLAELLYKQSGLLGLSGVGSDMRDLLTSSEPHAQEAVDYFVYRATWYTGALAAALGGLDALVFTAGIGQHASGIRERICRGLAWLGLELDDQANAAHRTRITTPGSKVSAWVVPTDEERMIALHVAALLKL